ncbi:tyrosine-type recombinase/integrase [Amylibacter sp.]|nr:tyrosine-type recombinase/integrase [Amylibacter sp.]
MGHGQLTFGSKRSTKLIKSWLKKKPEDIPWLICGINHDPCLDRPLCEQSVNEIIRKSIARIKDHKPRDWEISWHSLRIGAAHDLLIQGHKTIAIMRAGGWRMISNVNGYLQYAEQHVWN